MSDANDLSRCSDKFKQDPDEKENLQTSGADNWGIHGKILSEIGGDPSEFTSVKEPGSIQVQHLGPDKEFYLFMIPDESINPLSLIDSKVVVGGRKEQNLFVKEQQYKLVSYKSFSIPDTPSLFLPDEMGELHKVNLEIKGHVVLKGQPKILPNDSMIDIDALRSVQHKPPMDIKERNFLNNAGKRKSGKCSRKKRAVSNELDETSPTILKKKKKTTQNVDNKIQVENELVGDVDLSLDTSDAVKIKHKKSKKKAKNESLDLSEEAFQFDDDFILDSPKKKKSKKLNVTTSMDTTL